MSNYPDNVRMSDPPAPWNDQLCEACEDCGATFSEDNESCPECSHPVA